MNRIALAVVLTAAVSILVGCESDSGNNLKTDRGTTTGKGGSQSTLTGKIKIEGSSTVEPISNQAKDRFNETHPDVEISVGGQGTGNGFKSFSKKETDISDASRPIKHKELDLCAGSGLEFIEIPVAYDGLTIVVNPKNEFVNELTVDHLKTIFRKDKAASTWKDVDPAWPDKTINIFSPGTGSGTYDYFVEVVGIEKDASGEKTEIPLRDDDQILLSEDDNLLVTSVSKDEFSIGFFGYSYFERNAEKLKAIPIVNPKTGKAVAPSKATIESGEYAPFSRPLFIYVNVESLDRAEVTEFVEFYLENAREISEGAKYVGLPQEIYDRAAANLENRVTGTHFLDQDGSKREGSLLEVYQESNIAK